MNIDNYINKYAMASMTTLRRAAGRMYKGRKISVTSPTGIYATVPGHYTKSGKPIFTLPGGVKKGNPIAMHHEFAEARAFKGIDNNRKPSAFLKQLGHGNPSVLLNEHNLLTTLPKKAIGGLTGQSKKDYQTAGKLLKARKRSKESWLIEKEVRKHQPAFVYGVSPRLNRREIAYYSPKILKGYSKRLGVTKANIPPTKAEATKRMASFMKDSKSGFKSQKRIKKRIDNLIKPKWAD